MIYYDGKIYRNLEEQVLKNQKDIEIYSAGGNFALKGIVDGFDDLPESPTEGDYYLVGTGVPYELYLYYYNSWINLGEYPKEGPQGPQGIAGQNGATGATGPQGPKGDSLVYEILDIVPTTDDLPDPDSVDYWDAYLVGSAIPYMAYFVINGVWTPVGYITPQEAQNVVTADSANASSYKLMMSAQSGTRKIAESAWGITSTVVDTPNLIPSSQAVVDYVQNQVSAAVRFKGTVTFAQLSALASAELGDLYNISDSFTLSGVSYDAGTNLVCVTAFSSAITPSDTYWDAYGEAAVDLSPYMKSYTGDPTQWDTTPTASSTKPVTSGGIESAISSAVSGKQDTLTSSSAPEIGYIYLTEYDESQQGAGESGVLENVDGNLYFNGSAVGGGGGGIQNTATGGSGADTSFAISGNGGATATGSGTVVVGATTTTGNYGVYLGSSGYSGVNGGSSQVGIGNNYNLGNYNDVIGIGSLCQIGATRAIAIGKYSKASGSPSIAIGSGTSSTSTQTNASASNSIAIGSCQSAATSAITIGNGVYNNKNYTIVIGDNVTLSNAYGVAIGSGLSKKVDHDYAVVFNRIKFIPMTKSDSYTLASNMHGMTLTSSGVTYHAPSSTVTTGSSESALLICWYAD